MKRVAFAIGLATAAIALGMPVKAAPISPTAAENVAVGNDVIQAHYYHGHYYRYRWHGHYYRYHWHGHYYSHRHYRHHHYYYW